MLTAEIRVDDGLVPTDRVVNVLNMMIEAGYTDISYSGIPNNLIADLNQGKISAAAKN